MNNKIIISLISLIAVFGIVFFLVIPLWSSVSDLKVDMNGLKLERVEIERFLTKSRQIERNYLELEEEAQKVFLALPEGKDIPYLLIQFENIVRENGLLLDGIKFSQTTEEEKRSGLKITRSSSQEDAQIKLPTEILNLSVDVSVSGSYEAFKNYLSSLENNIRLMDIKRIDLKSQAENENSIFDNFGIFQFNLKINTYYQQ